MRKIRTFNITIYIKTIWLSQELIVGFGKLVKELIIGFSKLARVLVVKEEEATVRCTYI